MPQKAQKTQKGVLFFVFYVPSAANFKFFMNFMVEAAEGELQEKTMPHLCPGIPPH